MFGHPGAPLTVPTGPGKPARGLRLRGQRQSRCACRLLRQHEKQQQRRRDQHPPLLLCPARRRSARTVRITSAWVLRPHRPSPRCPRPRHQPARAQVTRAATSGSSGASIDTGAISRRRTESGAETSSPRRPWRLPLKYLRRLLRQRMPEPPFRHRRRPSSWVWRRGFQNLECVCLPLGTR